MAVTVGGEDIEGKAGRTFDGEEGIMLAARKEGC